MAHNCLQDWCHVGLLSDMLLNRILYRVIQEESAILWEMIVCVILGKKVHMNMGPILKVTKIW